MAQPKSRCYPFDTGDRGPDWHRNAYIDVSGLAPDPHSGSDRIAGGQRIALEDETESEVYPEGAHRISDEQRKILKDITGFEGYKAFLEDQCSKGCQHTPLLKFWRRNHDEIPPKIKLSIMFKCEIIDLIKDGDEIGSMASCCTTASLTELFTVLSEPGKDVFGRILHWRTLKRYFDHNDFLEDLGLALDIPPTYVEALYTKYYHNLATFAPIPAFAAFHVIAGDKIAIMTHCCISENSRSVPIALIADTIDPAVNPSSYKPIFQQLYQPCLSTRCCDHWKYILGIIARNSVFSKNAKGLLMPALLGDIYRQAVNLRASCGYPSPDCTTHGNGQPIEAMSTDRNELRRRIEEFEDVTQDVLIGLTSCYGADWSCKYKFEGTVKYFTQTIDRARRFEAYVQDQCQVQIGQLSLEESKRSIELSFSQIEEGKRGELRVHLNKSCR